MHHAVMNPKFRLASDDRDQPRVKRFERHAGVGVFGVGGDLDQESLELKVGQTRSFHGGQFELY